MAESATAIALVLGLVQVIKTLGINERYLPLIAVLVGVVVSALIAGVLASSILPGIAYGLMAMGLWSGGKTTLGK